MPGGEADIITSWAVLLGEPSGHLEGDFPSSCSFAGVSPGPCQQELFLVQIHPVLTHQQGTGRKQGWRVWPG